MPGHTAKVMLRFIDRIRVAAAHDSECEPGQNPLQRAYEVCVSKLSDGERGELVRIINKLSRQLEEPTGYPDHSRASSRLQIYDDPDQGVQPRPPFPTGLGL
jgi:hypothetical protein